MKQSIFRSIRMKLLDENRTLKYLKYATGEMILIVASIFFALQLNNWNEDQKAHRFENELLEELRQTIINDYSAIERVLEGNEASRSSCETILAHFDQGLPYDDSLSKHFSSASLWWQLNLRKAAFENAKSYGLHFIKSDSLRSLITYLYGNDVAFMDDMDGRYSLYHYNVVEPYIVNLFESTSFGSEMIPHDYNTLRNDKKYRTILKTNIGNRDFYDGLVENIYLPKLQELDRRLLEEIGIR